jgi:diaminopimelate decarboxylase
MLDEPEPYLRSARVVCGVARARLSAGAPLEFVDFGGGFGIDYGNGKFERPARFVERAVELLKDEGLSALELVIEPGRSLVGPHGVLLSRVLQEKHSGTRRWLMLDAGMNDLLRPALYGAFHRIEPLDRAPGGTTFCVVGPVCESADDFGDHPIGEPIPNQVVIRDAGAYGYSMASEYNGRALPGEVFLSGGAIVRYRPGQGAQAWIEGRLRS